MVHVWYRKKTPLNLIPRSFETHPLQDVSSKHLITNKRFKNFKQANGWVISYNLLITNSSNNTHKLFKIIRYFRTELPLITWIGPLPWGRNWRCHWGSQQPGLVERTNDPNASCCCWVCFGIQSGSKRALETWNSYMFHFSNSRLTKNNWLWVEKSSLLKPPHLK